MILEFLSVISKTPLVKPEEKGPTNIIHNHNRTKINKPIQPYQIRYMLYYCFYMTKNQYHYYYYYYAKHRTKHEVHVVVAGIHQLICSIIRVDRIAEVFHFDDLNSPLFTVDIDPALLHVDPFTAHRHIGKDELS